MFEAAYVLGGSSGTRGGMSGGMGGSMGGMGGVLATSGVLYCRWVVLKGVAYMGMPELQGEISRSVHFVVNGGVLVYSRHATRHHVCVCGRFASSC